MHFIWSNQGPNTPWHMQSPTCLHVDNNFRLAPKLGLSGIGLLSPWCVRIYITYTACACFMGDGAYADAICMINSGALFFPSFFGIRFSIFFVEKPNNLMCMIGMMGKRTKKCNWIPVESVLKDLDSFRHACWAYLPCELNSVFGAMECWMWCDLAMIMFELEKIKTSKIS